MSAPNPNNISYAEIVEKGKKFTNPEERYGSGVQIVCDKCQASPITEGYGLGPNDLCIPCANKVLDTIKYIDDEFGGCTLMMQDQFTEICETRGGNSPRTLMQQGQFRRPSSGTSGEDYPITNMRQRIYTKMAAGMFRNLEEEGLEPFFNPPRQSDMRADELQHRLDEMIRLREQPIGRFDDADGGISGFDSGGLGGSSLDAQFGGLLLDKTQSPQVPRPDDRLIQRVPSEPQKPAYSSGETLTRMRTNIYRTRMEMDMFSRGVKK